MNVLPDVILFVVSMVLLAIDWHNTQKYFRGQK